jgi:hypothetical protein
MNNNRFCNICARQNSSFCENCLKNDENLNFRPREHFKYMFTYSSCWKNKGETAYFWNTTNDTAIETRTVTIGSDEYCPYCGRKALSLQRAIKTFDNYSITGYCCLCEGALAEIEYRKKEQELLVRYEKERSDLRKEWSSKLSFNMDKLFEIQEEKRRQKFNNYTKDFSNNYFTTINDEIPTDIESILKLS